MKNIHDSWEEVERSTVTGVQRKGIQLSWMIEGLGTSAEDVPADVVRTAGEPESPVDPGRGPHCQDLVLELTDEEVLLGEERRMCFPETETTPGEDAVRTFGRTV